MSSNRRVEVFKADKDIPLYCIKFKVAKELVSRGRAEFIGNDDKAIRLIAIEIVAQSHELTPGNRQGPVYESAAIDTNRRYFGGGLNRTEHKPEAFSCCKGARVGHQ